MAILAARTASIAIAEIRKGRFFIIEQAHKA
jgi:hypothetical protein